jgi:hypothetical protein
MAQVVSLAEAAKLSNNLLVEGVIEDIITTDEFYKLLPFVMFDQLSYTFTREKRIAKVAFAAPGENLNQAKFQDGAQFENVNVALAGLIGDIIIDAHILGQLSEVNNQLAVQAKSKAKAMARSYMNAIINYRKTSALVQSNNGVIGVVNAFDGMKAILDNEAGNVDDVNHPNYNNGSPTQTKALLEDDASSSRLGLAGRVFTLEDLDDLLNRIPGKPDFIMMNAREMNTLRTLLRNSGHGADAAAMQTRTLGSEKPMLHYQDIPVFRNDFVSIQEPVNLIDTGAVAAVGATSITTAEDYSGGVPAALAAGILAGKAEVQIRTADGLLRRWKITVASVANPSVLTVTASGTFKDVESNTVYSVLAPNDGALGTVVGLTYNIYERNDGSEIYAGKIGEMEGVCGFIRSNMAGFQMMPVGLRENENAMQYRLAWYVGFETYSRLALARLKGCLPLQF